MCVCVCVYIYIVCAKYVWLSSDFFENDADIFRKDLSAGAMNDDGVLASPLKQLGTFDYGSTDPT